MIKFSDETETRGICIKCGSTFPIKTKKRIVYKGEEVSTVPLRHGQCGNKKCKKYYQEELDGISKRQKKIGMALDTRLLMDIADKVENNIRAGNFNANWSLLNKLIKNQETDSYWIYALCFLLQDKKLEKRLFEQKRFEKIYDIIATNHKYFAKRKKLKHEERLQFQSADYFLSLVDVLKHPSKESYCRWSSSLFINEWFSQKKKTLLWCTFSIRHRLMGYLHFYLKKAVRLFINGAFSERNEVYEQQMILKEIPQAFKEGEMDSDLFGEECFRIDFREPFIYYVLGKGFKNPDISKRWMRLYEKWQTHRYGGIRDILKSVYI